MYSESSHRSDEIKKNFPSSLLLGKHPPPKTDEFSEKFQTAFDPPPSFLENHVADF